MFKKLLSSLLVITCIGISNTLFADIHALLVGVGKYRSTKFTPLNGPSHDLDLVEKVLRGNYGVSNITILKNEMATSQRILAEFKKMKSRTGKDDIIFFYFSGHGTQVKDRNGDEADGWDEALVAYDYNHETKAGLILDESLAMVFNEMADRQVLSAIDSCHSGTITRSVITGKFISRWIPPSERTRTQHTFFAGVNPGMNDKQLPPKHILMSACQDAQEALETVFPLDGQYHGLFTAFFVKGLQGDADINGDGKITFRELYDNISANLRSIRKDQVPAVAVRDEKSLDLPFLSGKPRLKLKSWKPRNLEKVFVKFQGITRGMLTYSSKGFRMIFTETGTEWDFLLKRTGSSYELYDHAGDLIQKSRSSLNLLRRIDVIVLATGFNELKNIKQSFNLFANAGNFSRYYFMEGEKVQYKIRSEKDCYLLWLNIDSEGNVTVLLPNNQRGGDQNFLKKGIKYTIPGELGINFEFEVCEPFGKEVFKLIGAKHNINVETLFPRCQDEFSHFFNLDNPSCNSWEFYKKLKYLLSKTSNWAEASIEIETKGK